MTSERPTDSIIDLLYGELSDEDETLVRKELAESPELRAELDSYEDLLGRVRESMPAEDVPPSVHESIMEAARAGAKQAPEDRVARRQPTNDDAKLGIWRRLASGQGSQIALVAAVLIAGVWVAKFVDQGPSPAMAPASNISAAREPAPAPAVQRAAEKEMVADEAIEAEPAFAEQPNEAVAERSQGDAPDGDGALGYRADEAPQELAAARDARREPTAEEEPAVKPRSRPKRRRAATPSRTETKGQTKSAEGIVDLWGGDEESDRSGRSAVDDDVASREARGGEGPPSAPEAAEAEDAPVRQQEQREYQPERGSLGAVNDYWRRKDYNGTIRAADDFLASKSGTATQNARAQFLKAQALEKKGRYTQARNILLRLQKNHPTYETSQVESSLDRLERATQKKPAPQKRKARPKSTSDEMDMIELH